MGITAITLDDVLAGALEDFAPQEILEWSAEAFSGKLLLPVSLQYGGLVIVDMAAKLGFSPDVCTIDTGRLFPETLSMVQKVQDKYGIRIQVLHPNSGDFQKLYMA